MKRVDHANVSPVERRAELAAATPAAGSRATAAKPSAVRPFHAAGEQVQKGLDAGGEVPLHVRPVLTYAQLDELGVVPERTLRRLVAVGRVQRSVLRLGRSVRFVVQDLLDELRQAEA